MKFSRTKSSQREEEALAWAVRLDGGEGSPAEQVELQRWLESHPSHPWRLAHYREFYAQLHGSMAVLADRPSIRAHLPADVPWWRRGRAWAVVGAAVAAAIALVAWSRLPLQVATPAGHRESVTLSDGSRAELNARTELEVVMQRDRRIVRLTQGEAVFAVTKDQARPFYVETSAGIVRVTGTQFDVRRASSGILAVTVIEGSVAVQPRDGAGRDVVPPRLLTAGEQLVFDPATASLRVERPRSVEDVLAWREGKAVFSDTPLGEALAQFAAYHGKEISVAAEVAELPLGGRFTLDDLDQFIGSLERALPVRVMRNGDGTLRVIAAPRRP